MDKKQIESFINALGETIEKRNDNSVTVVYQRIDTTQRKIIDYSCDGNCIEFMFENGCTIIPFNLIENMEYYYKENEDSYYFKIVLRNEDGTITYYLII